REKVVEVVSHAAGHLPQGSELRRFDRLLLRCLELRVGGSEVSVQLRVSDGDRGLLSHRTGETHLFGAEGVLMPDADPQDAQTSSPRMTGAARTARIPWLLKRASAWGLPLNRASVDRSDVHTGPRISVTSPVGSSRGFRVSDVS